MLRISLRLLIISALLGSVSASAQNDIFDNPENLEVLPKGISPAELGATMRGFALGLGLRCSSCHQGEEGQPLQEYDFSNDDKPLKQTARVMLKMVNNINQQYLSELGDERLKVQCITCHRGVRKPQLTGEVLQAAYMSDGIAGMQQRYSELREQYFGTHSYDFSENVLDEVGTQIARSGNVEDGIATLKLNIEHYPESASSYFALGQIYRASQQTDKARAAYNKVIEIHPEWRARVKPFLQMLEQRIEE